MEAAIIPGYQIRNPAYLPIHDPIPGESQLDMILLKKWWRLKYVAPVRGDVYRWRKIVPDLPAGVMRQIWYLGWIGGFDIMRDNIVVPPVIFAIKKRVHEYSLKIVIII